MILVDERGGSKGLRGAQQRLKELRDTGIDADLAHLEFGDYAFIGNGSDNSDIMVGVELKTTNDLLTSLRTDRLAGHQVLGMRDLYAECWLITEGIWRQGSSGAFEYYQGAWKTYSTGKSILDWDALHAHLLGLCVPARLWHMHTDRPRDTATFLRALHDWWSKPYDEHGVYKVLYISPPDRAMFTAPSAFAKMVSCIPKVGWTRALAIEKAVGGRFDTLMAMSARELQTIDGIGEGIATIIRDTLHHG